MKNLRITTGLFLAIAATLFLATGCMQKNNAPLQQQNNQSVQSPNAVVKPTGVTFTYWDAAHKRIAFLKKPAIKQRLDSFYTALKAYYHTQSTASLTDSQFTYFSTEQFVGGLVPTIAVFNYPAIIANGTMTHVRSFRITDGGTPSAVYPMYATTPTPANADPMVGWPGLRTFTSAYSSPHNDVTRGGLYRSTPAGIVDFATRLDPLSNVPANMQDVIDAYYFASNGTRTELVEPNVAYPDPNQGYFINPKDGSPKLYNYWILNDGNGHETRVVVTLEEP